MSDVDAKAGVLLRLRFELGEFDPVKSNPYAAPIPIFLLLLLGFSGAFLLFSNAVAVNVGDAAGGGGCTKISRDSFTTFRFCSLLCYLRSESSLNRPLFSAFSLPGTLLRCPRRSSTALPTARLPAMLLLRPSYC